MNNVSPNSVPLSSSLADFTAKTGVEGGCINVKWDTFEKIFIWTSGWIILALRICGKRIFLSVLRECHQGKIKFSVN
jgi:hypothetical protein